MVAEEKTIVKVETSLLVPGSWGDALLLTSSIATVEALLRHIGDGMNLDLIDDQGDLIDFLDVKLNDKDVNFLPARLGTRLQNDDPGHHQACVVPIGGG